MDFQSASYGVDVKGMQQYIDDINAVVLTDVAEVLKNTEEIATAVDAGWVGQAPQVFKKNVKKGAEDMIDTLKDLQKAFEVELEGIKDHILEMDSTIMYEEN